MLKQVQHDILIFNYFSTFQLFNLSTLYKVLINETTSGAEGTTSTTYPDNGIYEIEVSPITFTAEYKGFKDTTVGPGWNIPQQVTSSYTVTREAKRFALLPYNITTMPNVTPFESPADKNLILVPHYPLDAFYTNLPLMYIYEDLDNPDVAEDRFKVLSAPQIVDIKYIPINSNEDAARYLKSKGVKSFGFIGMDKLSLNYADCEFEF